MPDNKDELKALISSLPYSYKVTTKAMEIRDNYQKMEGKRVSVAGRIMAIRKAGKLIFADVLDSTGKIQAYFEFQGLGEERFNTIKGMSPGDIIGIEGEVFKTTPGEVSIKVEKYAQLAKALRPLPDKWHGIQDTEIRYRKRYLDLIMNYEIRKVFLARSKMISIFRSFLEKEGFIEVETPVIQPLYGGATATPFKTRVNTLDEEDYLRISDELYLKKLIVGGLDKVFEICKDFRNEDVDATHSPEFTMLEWYQAYADYEDAMSLTEKLVSNAVKEMFGSYEITYKEKKISFKPPFGRLKFADSINDVVGKDVLSLDDKELLQVADKHGIKMEKWERNSAHIYDKLLKALVQPKITNPTFIVDYPAGTTTLCRPKRGDPRLIERFEPMVAGVKFGNGYSELNNPIIQRANFEREIEKSKAGDRETEPFDMDFVEAMEHGMPPTAGMGIGIDRLLMVLTDKPSMKEVILFPMEKREKK